LISVVTCFRQTIFRKIFYEAQCSTDDDASQNGSVADILSEIPHLQKLSLFYLFSVSDALKCTPVLFWRKEGA